MVDHPRVEQQPDELAHEESAEQVDDHRDRRRCPGRLHAAQAEAEGDEGCEHAGQG